MSETLLSAREAFALSISNPSGKTGEFLSTISAAIRNRARIGLYRTEVEFSGSNSMTQSEFYPVKRILVSLGYDVFYKPYMNKTVLVISWDELGG